LRPQDKARAEREDGNVVLEDGRGSGGEREECVGGGAREGVAGTGFGVETMGSLPSTCSV
jgi:hypothetical protein